MTTTQAHSASAAWPCLVALALSVASPIVRAACSGATVNNIAANFTFNTSGDKTQGSITEASGTINATCSGASNSNLFVTSANNPTDTQGSGIAKLGAAPLAYQLRRPGGGPKPVWGNVTGGSSNSMVIADGTQSYYVDGSTDSTFPAQGDYVDTLDITINNNANNVGTLLASHPTVTVTVPTQCFLVMPSSTTLSLNYTPKQSIQPSASLNVQVYCNVGYTISLDAAGGTVLDVTYGLSLSSPGTQPRTTAAGQQHTITATISNLDQFGTCPGTGSCNSAAVQDSGSHYVQISF